MNISFFSFQEQQKYKYMYTGDKTEYNRLQIILIYFQNTTAEANI